MTLTEKRERCIHCGGWGCKRCSESDYARSYRRVIANGLLDRLSKAIRRGVIWGALGADLIGFVKAMRKVVR